MTIEERAELNEKIEGFYGRIDPRMAKTFFEALIDDHVDIASGMMIATMGFFTPREWVLLSERIQKVTDRLDQFYYENESFSDAIDDITEAMEKLEEEQSEEES